MKSYTNIVQSRKLAEILPIETADGFWEYHNKWYSEGEEWVGKNYYGFYYVESLGHEKYTNIFNSPIDACYEMILKLHELNLL